MYSLNGWHNFAKGKVFSKCKNDKPWKNLTGKVPSPLFRRCTIVPPFLNFSDSPSPSGGGGQSKFIHPLFKKGGVQTMYYPLLSLVLVMLTRLDVSEPKHWVTWSQSTDVNLSFMWKKQSNTIVFLLSRIIFSSFLNKKFLFAFKMLFEEIKTFVFGLVHMHTDVNVAVFFHAYWKRSLKILKSF